MASEYWKQIKTEIDNFDLVEPEFNPNFAPTQSSLINLIDSYWVSKFRDGFTDSSGYKKIFRNIILKPVYIAQKLIDLDTRDVRVTAEDGQSYYPAWFYGKDLRLWMKSKKNLLGQTFGQFLNDIVYKWPKYGHILLKKAKGSVFLVPIQNIINDPEAESLLKSEYLIEKHQMGHLEFLSQDFPSEVDKDYIWDKYSKDGRIIIYERWGECSCMAGHNYHIIPENCEDDDDILFHDTIDRGEIYKELKWEDIPGRAIGRGQPEKLFENQISENTDENLFRTGLRWTSKHAFQTRDETIAKNLMTDIENGDVIIANSEITPIAMEERNLAAYNFAAQKNSANIADIAVAYESVSGERPPAGTPLGTTITQAQQAGAFFDQKKEDLGMFLKEVLFDWIIPDFEKEHQKEHSLMVGEFEEDEVEKLRRLVSVNRFNEAVIKFTKKNGYYPTQEEMKVLKGITKEQLKKAKELKLPDGYYKDIKKKIDIIITNEQIDMASRLTTLQTVLQIIGSNPTIMQDPKTRKVFYKTLDLAGINPTDLEITEPDADLEEEAMMLNSAKMGGSIARTSSTATPAVLPVPTRI